MNKEMLKGTIDLLILSVLKEQDSYGYHISKIITEKSDHNFEIQEATLYLALKRLEKQEYVESYWGKETHGGKRKYYHITQQGSLQLQEMKKDFQLLSAVVQKFL
ncbi:PadR family transcriptional regulator [Enterococcus mediterraneensis]|uniref:PadR family transcriptional regulator n=1 Tax=Enterococcus mediterraneensis TaxID=2364791 RepID=UPI000F060898|nr:helix-turn-helix transcriptional regulator [Enterococcus mediterraneensis]